MGLGAQHQVKTDLLRALQKLVDECDQGSGASMTGGGAAAPAVGVLLTPTIAKENDGSAIVGGGDISTRKVCQYHPISVKGTVRDAVSRPPDLLAYALF